METKKPGALARLMELAGNHKCFTYASCVLAVLSAFVALVPFYEIWRIMQEVLQVRPHYEKAVHLTQYGWQAVGFALLAWCFTLRH